MKKRLLVIALTMVLVFGNIFLNISNAMPLDNLKIAKVSAGNGYSMVIKSDGTLWAVGGNYEGQLGDDNITNYSVTPVQVMTDVSQVAASFSHTMAIKKDGTLWGWGNNFGGKLGDGTYMDHFNPIKITTDVIDVATGMNHTIILKKDGTLWGCGNDSAGQIGNGPADYCYEVSMNIMSDVKAISAGGYSTMVIKKDGTLWAFGDNKYGQLGDGTTTNRDKPVQVMTDVAYVDVGFGHTMVIKKDGSLWAFGENIYGQLGDDTTTNRNKPVQVMTDVSYVDAGFYHTMVIKKDGTLWGFGHNSSGQIAISERGDKNIPAKSILNEEINIQKVESDKTEVTVNVDGKKIKFTQNPVIKEGRTLVPLRAIFEALGLNLEWKQETQSIIATKDELTIELQIGNNIARIKDGNAQLTQRTLDVPPQIINNNTLVPVRFIGEATGAYVNWDQSTKTVNIKSKGNEHSQDVKLEIGMEDRDNSTSDKLGISIGDLNINLGDSVDTVVQKLGKPNRIDEKLTRLKWYVYNNNYSKFIMVGIIEGKVASLYTSHTDFIVNDEIKYGVSEKGLPQSKLIKYYIDNINGNSLYGIMISDENAGGFWGPVLNKNEHSPYFELQQLDCLNAFRVNNGLNVLQIDDIAQKTARGHSRDMADKDYFNHMALDGRSPWDRYNDNNGRNFACAENIVAGTNDGFEQFKQFLNSSGHRQAMLLREAKYVGIGVYYNENSQYKYYGTQLFSY